MAFAGCNPNVVPGIWARAAEKYGSNPGDLLYDHPLNADREKILVSLAPLAMRYYKGEGMQNTAYASILQSNTLIPRESASSGNGLVDLTSGSVGTYTDYLKAKNEEYHRQIAKMQQVETLHRTAMLHFSIAPTSDGHQGIFGNVSNLGTQPITSLQIAVYYYGSFGQLLYTQPIVLQPLDLLPSGTVNWSAYELAIPGAARIAAVVMGGSLGQ